MIGIVIGNSMRSKILSIIEYTSLLLKKYNELQQTRENNIYRIIEIRQLISNQYMLVIQVIGKSSVIECTPQEIVATDWLLEGFSKKDIRTITYFACEQIKKPKYKIIKQEFCEKFNRMIFKLKETGSDTLVIKTASQIVTDKNIIKNLSIEDAKSISYIAGYECSQSDTAFSKNKHHEI